MPTDRYGRKCQFIEDRVRYYNLYKVYDAKGEYTELGTYRRYRLVKEYAVAV